MPNFADTDRLTAKLRQAAVVDIAAYREAAAMESTARPHVSPEKKTWIAGAALVVAVVALMRRSLILGALAALLYFAV